MRVGTTSLIALVVLAGTACTGPEVRTAHARSSPQVTDSAIPIEESLRRFRTPLMEPRALRGGFSSREALVRGFVRALETSDTAALRRMVMSKEEFAWFYYPSSPQSRPPYELPPDLMWFQMQGQSERGASLLLAEPAGASFGYVAHRCPSSRTEGENRLHDYCVLRRLAGADTVDERLFGLIIERQGAFKFVSYANKLD